MNRRRIATGAVVLLALSTVSPSARAGFVTFAFEGEVTVFRDNHDALGGAVGVGSLLSGTYTFESLTPDSSPGSPTSGHYLDAVVTHTGQVGDTSFSGPVAGENSILVLNSAFGTDFDAYGVSVNVELMGINAHISLNIGDDDGDLLQDDHLPTIPPDLALAGTSWFDFGTTAEDLEIRGVIHDLALVPEPSTLALLVVSALPLVVKRRRRRVQLIGVSTGVVRSKKASAVYLRFIRDFRGRLLGF